MTSGKQEWHSDEVPLYFAELAVSAMRVDFTAKRGPEAGISGPGASLSTAPPSVVLPDTVWERIKESIGILAGVTGIAYDASRHYSDGPNVIRVLFRRI